MAFMSSSPRWCRLTRRWFKALWISRTLSAWRTSLRTLSLMLKSTEWWAVCPFFSFHACLLCGCPERQPDIHVTATVIYIAPSTGRPRMHPKTIVNVYCMLYIFLPSVLWRCWLSSRKGIRPVKNLVVGCWHGYLSGARCRLAYGPVDATVSCFGKIQIGFAFLVLAYLGSPGKGLLNGCVCVCLVCKITKWLMSMRHLWQRPPSCPCPI